MADINKAAANKRHCKPGIFFEKNKWISRFFVVGGMFSVRSFLERKAQGKEKNSGKGYNHGNGNRSGS